MIKAWLAYIVVHGQNIWLLAIRKCNRQYELLPIASYWQLCKLPIVTSFMLFEKNKNQITTP